VHQDLYLSAVVKRAMDGSMQEACSWQLQQRALYTNCLEKKDLGTTEFPKVETGLMDGEIAFRQHSAGHTPGPNWPVFLEFAERYFR
jgi:hypothetical protein